MAPKKKIPTASATTTETLAAECGVAGVPLTRTEAVALRVLIAFIDGRKGQVASDIMKDVIPIVNEFAEQYGWDD